MPLFGKSSKTPTEVVKLLKEALATIEKGGDGKKQEKAQEKLCLESVLCDTVVFNVAEPRHFSSAARSEYLGARLLVFKNTLGFSMRSF